MDKPQVVVELGIEFVFELLLFLYPYGAEQMNLPHNFWLGLFCWIAGTAIAVRMFWIFPAWAARLTRLEKSLFCLVFVGIFVTIFYAPVMHAYRTRDDGNRAAKEATQQPQMPSPLPSSTHNISEKPAPLKPPRQEKPHAKQDQKNSGGTNNQQSNSGGDNPQVGNVTQGPGSIAQIGGTGNSATIYNPPTPEPKIEWEESSSRLTQTARSSGRGFTLLLTAQ